MLNKHASNFVRFYSFLELHQSTMLTQPIISTQYNYSEFAPANGVPTGVGCISAGFKDIARGFVVWPLWVMLGTSDIRERYRRSTLGPFWITISMAVFILFIGFIYSRIFKIEVAFYIPFVSSGLIIWGFISGSISEATGSFKEGTRVIRQLRHPFSLYVLRTLTRLVIILAHTAVLMPIVWVVFGISLSTNMLLVFPGMALVFLNQFWVAIVIAVLATRFSDVVQIVSSAIQISMFATPIMWPLSVISDHRFIADFNPLYHLIQLVRMPMLGQAPEVLSWIVVLGMNGAGYLFAAWLLGRVRHRIVYWL